MARKTKKIKWYDTWWGALWALAIIDGSPGRSLRVFMEVDEALCDLDAAGENANHESAQTITNSTPEPCPTGSSAYCKA